MRVFGRPAIGNVIAMTRSERLAHIEHYRARTRELQMLKGCFAVNAPEATAMISTDVASFDRMVAILEDGLNQASDVAETRRGAARKRRGRHAGSGRLS